MSEPRQHYRPEFPPQRVFVVRRPNYGKTPSAQLMAQHAGEWVPSGEVIPDIIEQTVEAHRYYSDNAGALCFEQHVWDTFAMKVAARMPICMAPGTWFDVTEITPHFEARPTSAVN